MAASDRTVVPQAKVALTITLASLAASTAGVGRQSTLVNNSSKYPAALVAIKTKLGTSPTAGTVQVYLIRTDDSTPTIADDGAGLSDAALTVVGAQFLGTLPTKASPSTGDVLQAVFDTAPCGPLCGYWGIAIVNSTGVALDSTGGNHTAEYLYYQDEMS